MENPTVSQVIISIKGNAENFTSSNSGSSLNGLDGIEYSLKTDNSDDVSRYTHQ